MASTNCSDVETKSRGRGQSKTTNEDFIFGIKGYPVKDCRKSSKRQAIEDNSIQGKRASWLKNRANKVPFQGKRVLVPFGGRKTYK